MPAVVTYFAPQPARAELPARFPSPFAPAPPHPLARRAADELVAQLRAGMLGVDLAAPGAGKMFGALVVEAGDGRIGYLRAFSGMVGERWQVDGFAPPVFDVAARDRFWPAGEAELAAIDREIRALATGPARAAARAELVVHDAHEDRTWVELRARHRANRRRRREQRRALVATALTDDQLAHALHLLDQDSRGDTAERRALIASLAATRDTVEAGLRAIDARIAALEQHRTDRSRQLLHQIFDTYLIPNARGDHRPLRALFSSGAPPGGAGDCAGPKLLAEAYRHGLRPIAIAELWWGGAPVTGDRVAGTFYPACRGKCGPILPWMLDGLPHDDAPVFGAASIDPAEPRTVFEDDWLIVVDKPVGLLSVPGRSGLLQDSVQTRLRLRLGDGAGPIIVHRLDLDTSGLMLAAKDADTHTILQRLFARREIDKRYIAWLAGDVAGDHGAVDLALRVDVDDRPRQIHDPVHGKPAVTEWQVLARVGGRTRVALVPRTGRTHQLRVHAAHPLGIGIPIVGDRLYGVDDTRLMLHAEALAFVHPRTGTRIELERPAPF